MVTPRVPSVATSPVATPMPSPTPAPAPAPDPVIAAAGDIACDPSDPSFNAGKGTARLCRQKYTAALVSSWNPTAVLGLGDFQYEHGTLAAYAGSFDLSWGKLKAITFPTPGNAHDGYGGSDYLRYWGGARPEVKAAGVYRPYSFDLGAWHVVSVPSGCVTGNTTVSCAKGGAIETWLRHDLAAHPSACTMAIWHNPRWTSTTAKHGSFTETQPYWAAVVAAHADVVLSGDNHNYERFLPQDAAGARDDAAGAVQFVVGTGGKVLMPITKVIANSAARDDADFGALRMTLHPASYDFRFVTESGAVKDAGTGVRCH